MENVKLYTITDRRTGRRWQSLYPATWYNNGQMCDDGGRDYTLPAGYVYMPSCSDEYDTVCACHRRIVPEDKVWDHREPCALDKDGNVPIIKVKMRQSK
jgi:hypothetical protein